MDNVSHTKGPWFVVPYGDGDSLVVCSDQGGEWRICFMATHGGSRTSWEAIKANAHLIAAAPELLGSANSSLDLINDLIAGIGVSDDRLREVGGQLARTIATAEGCSQ